MLRPSRGQTAALVLSFFLAVLAQAGCSSKQSTAIVPGPPFRGGSAQLHPAAVGDVNPAVPAHVQDFTFWNQSGIATTVPVSWMATWATWIETRAYTYADEFHSAGGKYTVTYTNANYYYVSPKYTSPGIFPETAFGHGSNGVRTQWDGIYGGTEYYLLPNSTASQNGFAGVVQSLTQYGGFNYVYVDGVSDSLTTSLWGHRLPVPVEITTNAQYVTGMKQLVARSSLPTIINGYNNGDPVTEEEYVGAPNIAAVFGEACFTQPSKVLTGNYWIHQEDALIFTTAHGLYAICGGRGPTTDSRPQRIYYFASWLLTYDPNRSVSLEEFASSGGVYVFPEQMIVPTDAFETASEIGSLKWWTGVYMRRFGTCYYDRVSWGACAAVVNSSSTASSTLPSIALTYHHSLALDLNNLYAGGKATLSSTVPTTLLPGTAVILFQ
jgi:hypothetical protein